MGEVIAFGSKNNEKRKEYQFTVEVYRDEHQRWSGEIVGFNEDNMMSPGDRVRYVAEGLDSVSFHSYQYAEKLEPSERGHLLANVSIFQNSDVRMSVLEPMITDHKQREWVRERLEHAKSGVKIYDGTS